MSWTDAERLVEVYADLILRLCYTYLRSTADAEDICQEVLVKLLRRREPFEDGDHERAWVIRVTVNACKDLVRFRSRHGCVALDDVAEPSAPVEADPLVEAETDASVLACVQRLPRAYREAVFLFYYEGRPLRFIAEVAGCSEDTAAQRLSRARRKLRELLREEGFDGYAL